MSNDLQLEKRVAKCPSCGTSIAEHGWGIPSKYCQREGISSPGAHKDKQIASVSDDVEDQQIAALEQELAELDLEEQRQAKHKRIASKGRLKRKGPSWPRVRYWSKLVHQMSRICTHHFQSKHSQLHWMDYRLAPSSNKFCFQMVFRDPQVNHPTPG